ncbi:DNA damage-inducible protein 1 [Sporothrix brasiliensis 5110]|uniref:DNA damage-inducible protein 1 n=1 Tax=Sporothrix brasiliensis 5110 TaxID=1398154 RepID=A0A0C2J5J5_9PEZI|nr:DNA damage-inducible protein 1 [Sporothrix brasiliensis 5110]KIH92327.1 DNA damage-inducible protein 1 [Sporothrix brasiliensis 5110]
MCQTSRQITVTVSRAHSDEPDLLSLEVYPEMTVETLQSSIEAETSIPPSAQHLYHDGNLITDKAQTLEALHVTNGDMIAMHIREPRNPGAGSGARASQQAGGAAAAAGTRQRQPGEPDPEVIRLQILGDPRLREEAIRQQPQLASVIDDPQLFAQFFNNNYDRERRERQDRQRQIAQLNADPFDIEAQARIEEIIRQERVMENLQNAMEHNPEDVEVNGYKVKALVDSGAQATIMSPGCAEACGIMRLVDKRFAGVARGVGTATIIGRVHSAQIKIGSLFLPCSFTVMEGKSVDLLLGLDMLKRYQASIDLAKDRLIIQDVEIPFLGEADIPKDSEEALAEEPTFPGPSGTTIGQRSGVVSGPEGQEGSSAEAAQVPPAAPAAASAPARPQPQTQTQQQPLPAQHPHKLLHARRSHLPQAVPHFQKKMFSN